MLVHYDNEGPFNVIQISLSNETCFISATKDGLQMSGIAKMIERIAGVEMS